MLKKPDEMGVFSVNGYCEIRPDSDQATDHGAGQIKRFTKKFPFWKDRIESVSDGSLPNRCLYAIDGEVSTTDEFNPCLSVERCMRDRNEAVSIALESGLDTGDEQEVEVGGHTYTVFPIHQTYAVNQKSGQRVKAK